MRSALVRRYAATEQPMSDHWTAGRVWSDRSDAAFCRIMLDTLIVLLFNCLRKVKRLNGLDQCSKGGAARASISRAVTVMINTGIHVHSIMADSI